MRTIAFLALVVLAGETVARAGEPASLPARHAADVQALLAGVAAIGVPGVPGSISVYGPEAFPVVLARVGGRPAPVVAATRLGRGRAVMFGHNGWFGNLFETADTGRLLVNACRWAARGAEHGARSVRVAVRRRAALLPHLRRSGLQAEALDGPSWTRRLDDFDVLLGPVADVGEKECRALRAWLEGGGGLLCGLPGWGWQQLHPGKDLATENMGNRLLAPAGLVWGSGSMQVPATKRLAVPGPPAPLTHAGLALDALVAQADGRTKLAKDDSALAVATVTRAIRDLPPGDDLLRPRLGALRARGREGRFLPTASRPLGDDSGLGKLLLTLQLQEIARLPPEKIRAHPAAEHFPGAVPKGARRVQRTVEIDTSRAGWHGTGLYAPAGEVVRIRVPESAVDGRLSIRIGPHKDRLWSKAQWRRAPDVTSTFDLTAPHTRVASAFGGLVYVVVPPRCELGAIRVGIAGAVEAPLYALGRTDLRAWRETIRHRPAPWAELATSKVVITLPSEHVRRLEDPEALMTWWDSVMDACADLAATPRERQRPERYVADVQISAGYMHAGYPIMTHLDAAKRFVDLERLSTKGDWGMFHEMGHNHQRREWTFDGTGEVTVNLFSLYCMETVCKKGVGHPAMSRESIAKSRALYDESGRDFGLWKRKPFMALIMYQQLRTAFGWEAYKRVFAEYRDLADHERPRTDDEKRDQWLVRMSRSVGRDLGPFFESWGVPTSQQARDAVKGLPGWMPE